MPGIIATTINSIFAAQGLLTSKVRASKDGKAPANSAVEVRIPVEFSLPSSIAESTRKRTERRRSNKR